MSTSLYYRQFNVVRQLLGWCTCPTPTIILYAPAKLFCLGLPQCSVERTKRSSSKSRGTRHQCECAAAATRSRACARRSRRQSRTSQHLPPLLATLRGLCILSEPLLMQQVMAPGWDNAYRTRRESGQPWIQCAIDCSVISQLHSHRLRAASFLSLTCVSSTQNPLLIEMLCGPPCGSSSASSTVATLPTASGCSLGRTASRENIV